MKTINRQEAMRIALEAMAETDEAGHDFSIVEDRTEEYEFGWVFRFLPRRFLETGDIEDLVPGTGPVIVDREGTVTFVSTASRPEVEIEKYLEAWRTRRR